MNPRKILIIQLRRIGDVLFTLPVLGVLRRALPDSQIDFLVEKPADQFVRLNPFLNETLVYDSAKPLFWIRRIRAEKYDWVLDFHSNGRTLILSLFSGAALRAGLRGIWTRDLIYNHSAETTDKKYLVEQKLDLLRSLGIAVSGWEWNLKIPQDQIAGAENFLRSAGHRDNGGKKNLVGIAPVSRRETRRWESERFAEVTRALLQNSRDVLFLSGQGERPVIDRIVQSVPNAKMGEALPAGRVIVPPETSLLELAALIQKCSLVLAVDNGPKNIAVALGVPTITIVGPTNPLSFNPHHDPKHKVIREDALFCIACGLNRCPYQHECMQNISAARVIKEIELLGPAASDLSLQRAVLK